MLNRDFKYRYHNTYGYTAVSFAIPYFVTFRGLALHFTRKLGRGIMNLKAC